MKANRGKASAARREGREFSAEFNAEAVRMIVARRAVGVTLAQVGRELEVRPDRLRVWARQVRDAASGAPAVGESVEQENRRLRRCARSGRSQRKVVWTQPVIATPPRECDGRNWSRASVGGKEREHVY